MNFGTTSFGGFGGFGAPTSSSAATTNVFGSAPSGGLFGAPAASASGSGLFGSAPAPATGLFGATPASAPAGGLFGATPASAPAGGLFGSTPAAAPATGLFGSAPASAPATGLFGANPTTTTTGTAMSAARQGVLEHRKLDEVLNQWESRMTSQAQIFAKFAETVTSVDHQLIFNSKKMKEISDDFLKVKANSQKVDLEISTVHAQQEALGRLINQIETTLSREKAGFSTTALPTSDRLVAVYGQLDDLERNLDDIVAELDRAVDSSSSNQRISGLVKLISLHQNSIDSLTAQSEELKSRTAAMLN